MDRQQSPADRLRAAEHLLAEFHVRSDAGESADFEAFVAIHREVEPELRELHAACHDVSVALDSAREQHARQRSLMESMLNDIRGDLDFRSRYRIEGELGRGGMGAILRVRDTKLDRVLAMKVILGQAEVTRTGKTPPIAPSQLARFLNEARVTSQLDHPGIVPVHEIGVDELGRAFFTMKLVQGRTLAEVFRLRTRGDPEWSTARALGLVQRMCEALAYAHQHDVIHRDLKPENVMVGDFGEVFVMDWGLARRMRPDVASIDEDPVAEQAEEELRVALSERSTITRAGQIVGTPAYMSPEQAAGRVDELGPRSDVYSVGAMLYELVSGHPPYCGPGDRPELDLLIESIQRGPPARLSSDDGPREVVAICEKAIARDPDARYADVGALAQDMQAYLDGRVVRAYETGAWAEAKSWVLRNRVLSACFALLAVATLASAFLWNDARVVNAADAHRRSRDLFRQALLREIGDARAGGAPRQSRTSRDAAIEGLNDALKMDSGFEEARLHLAVMLNEAGRREEALAELDRLHTLSSTTRSVVALRDHIKTFLPKSNRGSSSPGVAPSADIPLSSIDNFYLARANPRNRRLVLSCLEHLHDDPLYGPGAYFIEGVSWTTGSSHDYAQGMRCFEAGLALMPDSDVILGNLASAMLNYCAQNRMDLRARHVAFLGFPARFELLAASGPRPADFWLNFGLVVKARSDEPWRAEQVFDFGVHSCRPTLRLVCVDAALVYSRWSTCSDVDPPDADHSVLEHIKELLRMAQSAADPDAESMVTLAEIALAIEDWESCDYFEVNGLGLKPTSVQRSRLEAVIEARSQSAH